MSAFSPNDRSATTAHCPITFPGDQEMLDMLEVSTNNILRQSHVIAGDIEAQNKDLTRIEESIEASNSLVDENTRLLRVREQADRINYWGYYYIIAVELAVLLFLLYIGL